MLVLACLPPDLLARLRSALGDGNTVAPVAEWSEIERHAISGATRVIVADPLLIPDTGRRAWPSGVSFVLYVTFSPEGIRRSLALTTQWQGAPVSVAIRGHDDSPPVLRQLITSAAAAGLAERVASRFAPYIASLPRAAQEALIAAIHEPLRFRTVGSLGESVGLSQQTLRRWTRAVHVASPKLLLVVGRVLWAYQQLGAGVSVQAVASRLGYTTHRDLARHVRQITGRLPSALRTMPEEQFIAEVVRRLVQPAPPPREF